MKKPDTNKLDRLVASARADYSTRENGYRQRALKLYPWVCGRCMRDNNPQDGSNWELLCVYCHDNEHQRYVEQVTHGKEDRGEVATHNPFADLKSMLKKP